MSWGSRITYLGETAVRERTVAYGIKDADRTGHVCIVGRAGSGRESLVASMALQDIRRGFGVLVLDAGGTLGTQIVERLTKEEVAKVVYLDASDAEYPYAWSVADEFRAAGPLGKKLFSEYMASIYGLTRTKLVDEGCSKILDDVSLTPVSLFDLVEQSQNVEQGVDVPADGGEAVEQPKPPLDIQHEQETAALIIEHGVYIRKDSFVRNVLGQDQGLFTLKGLADGAIIIVDVSRIRMFPTRMAPIIRSFVYGARAAAAATNEISKLYIHDCLRYLSEADAEGVMNDRSVALTLADTIYREEDLPLREKSLARCGTVFTFQPHPADAPLVEKSFYPFISSTDLQQLSDGEGVVMLTIDGVRSQPFFTKVAPLGARLDVSVQDVIGESRQRFARTRNAVEELFRPKPKPRPPRERPPKDPQAPQAKERKRAGGFSDAFRAIFEQQAQSEAPAPASPASEAPVQAGEQSAAEQAGQQAPVVGDRQSVPPTSLPFPGDSPRAGPASVDDNMLATILYVPRPA